MAQITSHYQKNKKQGRRTVIVAREDFEISNPFTSCMFLFNLRFIMFNVAAVSSVK
jgi:hypothetical protein